MINGWQSTRFKNNKLYFEILLEILQQDFIVCESTFIKSSLVTVNYLEKKTFKIMRLCHPPDGSTSPKYKLLCTLYHHNLFHQIHNALAFNRDTCFHLALCLPLLPFHCLAISFKLFQI
jgi:hypothetical protein